MREEEEGKKEYKKWKFTIPIINSDAPPCLATGVIFGNFPLPIFFSSLSLLMIKGISKLDSPYIVASESPHHHTPLLYYLPHLRLVMP